MSISLYPAASSPSLSVPNWQLVTSSAPAGVATVVFSGLAGYSKYRLLSQNIVNSSAAANIYLNGDTVSHYTVLSWNASATSFGLSFASPGINLNSTGTTFQCDIQVENALLLAPKAFNGWASTGGGTNGTQMKLEGLLHTTSLLTSITITLGANFTSGTIFLLGAN